MPPVDPLDVRIRRYARIVELRADPSLTLDDIGQRFDPPLTRQRVQQILDAGMPKRPGRPMSLARRDALRRTLGVWEERLANRSAKGLDTANAERRIAAIRAELAVYGPDA